MYLKFEPKTYRLDTTMYSVTKQIKDVDHEVAKCSIGSIVLVYKSDWLIDCFNSILLPYK